MSPSEAAVGDILLELLRRFRKTIGVTLKLGATWGQQVDLSRSWVKLRSFTRYSLSLRWVLNAASGPI